MRRALTSMLACVCLLGCQCGAEGGEDAGPRGRDAASGYPDAGVRDGAASPPGDAAPPSDSGAALDSGGDGGAEIEAPVLDVEWWRQVGSTSIDHVRALAVAPSGDLLVAGEFRTTVDFGETSVSALGAGDAFVARYRHDGRLAWVVGLGSAQEGADNADATDVAVSTSGLVAVTGTFEGRLEAVVPGGGSTLAPLDALGRSDAFVVVLDADGHPLWSRGLGSDTFDHGGGVAFGAGDHLVVAAEVGQRVRVESVAHDGSLLWSRESSGILTSYSDLGAVQAVALDSRGDVFIAGVFSGATELGGSVLRSAGGGDFFVAKLSGRDGAHVWSSRYGSALSVIAESDNAWDLAVSGDDVIVVGDANGRLDLGGGAVDAARAGFVARYRGSDGAHVWSRLFDGSGTDGVTSITEASDDELLVAGIYDRGISLGGARASGHGSFVVRLSADDGRSVAATVLPAPEGASVAGAAAAPDGRAFVSFDFYGEVTIAGSAWSSRGSSDFLLGSTRAP